MTRPSERTRALRWAGEFLQELAADPDLKGNWRTSAAQVLTHYPSAQEIEQQALADRAAVVLFGPWLAPEDEHHG